MAQRSSRGISPSQQIAIQRLVAGENIASIAEALQVDRTTIYRWIRNDYEFQAALNRERRNLQFESQNLIMALVEPAMRVIRAAIEQGNLQASLAVLKGIGVVERQPISANAEDPQHLRKMTELEDRKRLAAEQGIDWEAYMKANCY